MCSYDNIGNPTKYRNVDMVWQKGRQLKSMGIFGITVVSYEYNIDGLRTKKSVYGNADVKYLWSSGLLMQQTDGTNTLNFAYAPDGRALGVKFNGTDYYYIYNLQGDVIGLYNYLGSVVVEYTYDSWGKLISTTGSLASTLGKLNPFRYRGYIYDDEMGLYYLRSRYYDPDTGRFLNADGYVSTGTGLNGFNMFAYCNNNPVNSIDFQGNITVGLFANANITLGVGVSIAIGVVIDDNGNFDVQLSYSLPKTEKVAHVGAIDIGVGAALQFTKADTVYDLYGIGTCIGASGGPGLYAGIDVISPSTPTDTTAEINGFQVTAGYGVGVDVHVVQTYTKSLINGKKENYSITEKEIRKYSIMEKKMFGGVL